MAPFRQSAIPHVVVGAALAVPFALNVSQMGAAPVTVAAAGAVVALILISHVAPTPPVVNLGCLSAAVLVAMRFEQWLWPYLAVPVVAYLIGRRAHAGRRTLMVPAAAVTVLGVEWLVGGSLTTPMIAFLILVATVLLPWWIGSDARARAALRHEAWVRAEQLEHEQRLVARTARRQERARVAADMHDALGYELSVLALTAGAGEVDPTNTSSQREHFERTRSAAVNAVHSLHEVLRVLRDDEQDLPTPKSIDNLVERHRRSGVHIDAHLDTDGASWPYDAHYEAYRATQEILTNAMKHAPGQQISYALTSTHEDIRIRASNPLGTHHNEISRSGTGLASLTDRVHARGGHVAVERDKRNFTVTATIPLVAPKVDAPVSSAGRLLDGQSAIQTAAARWKIAVLSIVVSLITAGGFLLLNAISVEQVGLSDHRYSKLSLGSPEDAVRDTLPPSRLSARPPNLPEAGVPAGSRCELYVASESWFDTGGDYYQLCFMNGVLVVKEHLP